MIKATKIASKSDIIGVMASGLCFLHCVATPFLFVAHASIFSAEASHPWWWGGLDITFLSISFFAVYWSTRTTSIRWMKYAMWISLLLLSLIIFNEKLEFWHITEEAIYLPSTALVFLHIYNHRFCRRDDEICCAD